MLEEGADDCTRYGRLLERREPEPGRNEECVDRPERDRPSVRFDAEAVCHDEGRERDEHDEAGGHPLVGLETETAGTGPTESEGITECRERPILHVHRQRARL